MSAEVPFSVYKRRRRIVASRRACRATAVQPLRTLGGVRDVHPNGITTHGVTLYIASRPKDEGLGSVALRGVAFSLGRLILQAQRFEWVLIIERQGREIARRSMGRSRRRAARKRNWIVDQLDRTGAEDISDERLQLLLSVGGYD